MGDEQDDYLAARRAAFEQQVQALPVGGSAAYWQCIETTGEGRLPLEVLSRCLRERLQAGAREEAERVFGALWLRIQRDVQFWAQRIQGHYRAGKKLDIAQELEEECLIALWQELFEEGPTFLLEHFGYALNFIEMNVAQAVLEKEGLKQRGGVKKPKRPPRQILESLEAQKENDGDLPIIDTLPDPDAQTTIEQIASFLDLLALLEKLTPEHRIVIYLRYIQGLTPQEIAEELGLTDRAVRYRIEKALKELRPLYFQEEGVQHG